MPHRYVRSGSNLPYVIAVCVMAFIACGAVVLVVMSRPGQDNVLLVGAIFGFVGPFTMALLAFMKAQETHLSVNSRLDAFMEAAARAARAEGHISGVSQEQEQERDRQRLKLENVVVEIAGKDPPAA